MHLATSAVELRAMRRLGIVFLFGFFAATFLLAQKSPPVENKPDAQAEQAKPAATTPPPDSTVLELVKKVKPEYPSAALPQKLQGRVIVRAVVSEIGDVETVEIVSGDPVLANAAAEAVKQWKFKPFIHDSKPVKAAIKLPFDFVPPEPAGNPVSDAASISNSSGDSVPPSRVKVSSGVIAGMIIHKVTPEYPGAARAARLQGTVVLQAIISKEGKIENLRAISGHPMLVPAAMDAVKQWRYKPYFLKGEPVAVDTMITVNFALAGGNPDLGITPPHIGPTYPGTPSPTTSPNPSASNPQSR